MTSNSVVSHYFNMPLREVKYNWKEEAIYFFERQGYKIAYKGDTEYVFKAGSQLGNIISFNPAKVEREAVIREENNTLYCELRVSLDFRICTQLEIEYARWELASFKVFLSKSGNIPQKPNAPELILLSLLGFAKQILKYAFAFIILGAVLILVRIYIMPKINSAIVGGPRINLNENLSSTQRAPEGVADIYIFPFYGFPESLAGAIAVKLSEDLKINVRATPSLPILKTHSTQTANSTTQPPFTSQRLILPALCRILAAGQPLLGSCAVAYLYKTPRPDLFLHANTIPSFA